MEDKIKELTEGIIKEAKELGVDIKVVKVNNSKSESIKKILKELNELEENMEPETLIQYEFKISPIENSIFGGVDEAMIRYVEDISTLTKEDIIGIFKPVESVFEQCGEEFVKKLNANKKTPSFEEVKKMIVELLEGNKYVN